jgi:serine/threonine protein kinase/Tol biopolymer transport system component
VFGGYTVVSLLGRGGMGDVYRARDERLGRDVAIKVLPPGIAGSAERVARFEREARLLASLTHPHIAAIYGIVEDAGVRGLVLELVDGQTLGDRIASGMTRADALRLAEQIVDALDLAHERGVVHRDLKPENIKVTPDGGIKILDFGIAKMRSDTEDVARPGSTLTDTAEGVVLGTAAFMSPEQARGKPVDKRADIWAFGCLLYQMLAGRQAFAGETSSDTIAAVLDREPDWSALPAGTPPSIRRLLGRCLEKDVRRRLRDIGDARHELAEARGDMVNGLAAGAVEQSPRRRLVASTLLAALGLSALAATAWGPGRERGAASDDAAAPPRLTRTVRLTNTPAREFGPAISPDGKWVAYYSDARGPTDIWVKYLDSGATLNLTATFDMRLPTRTNIGGLAISPDGTSLAFFATRDPAQHTFDTWVMPAPLGGPPRKLLQGMQGAQWSPDGKRLACVLPGSSLGDALIVADADGTNGREILAAAGGRHIHWPTWSRDGRSVYFIHTYQPWNTEQSEIYRVTAAGGAPEPVVRSIRRAVYPVPLPGGDLLFSANPESVDLGLWWQPGRGGPAVPLTTGLGEYMEPRLSSDGRRLVAMVLEQRQSLVEIDVRSRRPAVRPLTDGYGGDIDPSYDPASDRIVFSSTRSGHRNLWIARQDGTDARPLTSETVSDWHPIFSPDGRRIAFVSDRGGRWGIWVVSADGGAPRLLTPAIVFDSISWSPDGSRILFVKPASDRSTVLSTVSVADGTVQPFPTPAAAIAPSWSPASGAVVYLQPTIEQPAGAPTAPVAQMLIKFVDGQGRLLYPGLPPQRLPNGIVAWAPDGRRVAIATVPANSPSVIWIVEPAAAAPFRRLIELQPTVRPRGLTWTRDGARLVMASQESLSDLVLYELER